MGYFDGLVSGAFKKDAAGHTVFYPWGILGKGYVVPSVVEEERLRSFLKTMYMILLPGIIIIQVVFGAWVNFVIVIPVYIAWYVMWVRRTTAGMQVSVEKLAMGEAYKNSARSHNLPTLIVLEIFALGFVAIGLWMLSLGKEPVIAGLCVGFFGLCAVAIGYMIKQKVKG